jgi:hypothetical protein
MLEVAKPLANRKHQTTCVVYYFVARRAVEIIAMMVPR